MSVVNSLHSFLQQLLLFIHAARLQALMAAVEAGLSGASISITALGQAVSGDAFIKHKIKRPFIISGDRHIAEISKMKVPGLPYALYDFTSSGLTHTWSFMDRIEKNEYRTGSLIMAKNFGMLLIDWSVKEPVITFEIRGKNEKPLDPPLVLDHF